MVIKKQIHPFWIGWFVVTAALPGTIAYASTANNRYITAYTVLHGVAVFIGFCVAQVTYELPLLREVPVEPKRDSELETLKEENRKLSEALIGREGVLSTSGIGRKGRKDSL